MITAQKRILKYQFEDSKQLVNATILGNLMLAIILLTPGFSELLDSLRVQLCLITGISLLVLSKIYDWKSNNINVIILLSYLGLVFMEFVSIGLPEYPISYDFESFEVSKGIMFDIFIWMLPPLYMLTRILLVIPLVSIFKTSKKL
jgi:hypothetical protein